MPGIESSEKCQSAVLGPEQRKGDKSALVALLSQELLPLLKVAQREMVMEHALILEDCKQC